MAELAHRSRSSFVVALQAAFARSALWGSLWAAECALAVIPAAMWFGWMNSALQHRFAPGELFGDLGTVFRFDQRDDLVQLEASSALAGAVLGLMAMLLGVFAAGGWLSVFLSRTREGGLGPFLRGGARFFWRFLRVMLLTIAALALVTWILRGAPWDQLVLRGLLRVPATDFVRLETLSSEQTVFVVRGAQTVLHGLAVGCVLAWATLTRTRLALFDTGSAAWAGFETLITILLHPVRTLGPLTTLFLFEVLVATGFGLLAHQLEAQVADLGEVAVLFALGQVVLGWRIVLRGARYHAAVSSSLAVVRPIAKPDPWRKGPFARASMGSLHTDASISIEPGARA